MTAEITPELESPPVAVDLEPAAVGPSPGAAAVLAGAALLAACGGGGGGSSEAPGNGAAAPAPGPSPAPAPAAPPPTRADAARFLMQASFGPRKPAEVDALVASGFEPWLAEQMRKPAASQLAYLESQRGRDQQAGEKPRVSEEMSYEALWQQWLKGEDSLRGRMSWALLQIFVISNIAPDIRPHAMSSYLDMLNRNAFGNWRQLLEDVSLHPAMGYYLNLLESEKEDPAKGTHPNENYAREVLQLFSIGLVQLNLDGSPKRDVQGQTIPTFDENVVKGFAKAFSGWSYGGLNNQNPNEFHDHDDNIESLWTQAMQPWAAWHSSAEKQLLDGKKLATGGSARDDLKQALDCIFEHPNVPPFFARQLIQRLVSSNPSPAYIQRVAQVFVNDGSGVRGNLAAVLRAVLLDAEARGDGAAKPDSFGKLREPVLRLAALLRALDAQSASGFNRIHYLDSADEGLGQSPLLAPSVFNFYSPNYRPAGALAAAGLVAPEFQITTETSAAGSLNFFHELIRNHGYGWPEAHRLKIDYTALEALAAEPAKLIDHLDLMLFALQMRASTRARLNTLLNAIAATDRHERVEAALIVCCFSPDFTVQR